MENPNSREHDERPHQRDRHGQQRDEGCAPSLQEDVHHDDHQDDGDHQCLDDLPDAFGDRARGIQRNRVIDAVRQSLPLLGEKGFDPLGRLHGIRPWQLIHRDDRARLSVQMTDDGVVLRAEFDPRDVLDPHDPAVWSRANDDLLELLRGRQPSLRLHRVAELLPLRRGLAADLTGGIHGVL